jgi:hypothetical protein
MRLGFALFERLDGVGGLYEVFPTASYKQLDGQDSVELTVNLQGFAGGPKDMMDACVAALTVREFVEGRGQAVGGGDGLGQIILPRPVADQHHPVLAWPADS